MARINITTPVGRLVGGSLYDPETTDYDGKPLVARDGSPRVNYQFGVAIPKTPGVTHWANEPWGAPIYALALAEFPNGETQRHDFSWKITDGDSQVPNKKGRKPCEREGYAGHWVIWFAGGYAPTVYNKDGTQTIAEKYAVKPGYYVQVFGNISDNKPSQSPGLYVNHTYVALTAYGPEISVGPDVSAAGFGQGVSLPPGASLTPPGGAFNPQPPAVPGVSPAAPAGMPPPPPSAPSAATLPSSPPPAPPVAVAPHPGILTPPAPPAAPARTLTAAAQGQSYEQLIAAGWTDALLIQHGLMVG